MDTVLARGAAIVEVVIQCMVCGTALGHCTWVVSILWFSGDVTMMSDHRG